MTTLTTRLPPNGPPAAHADRILLVTPSSPFHPTNGSQQRTSLLLEALLSVGEVDVLGVHQGATTEAALQRSGYTATVTWRQATLARNKYKTDLTMTYTAEQSLGRRLTDYSLIVGRYLNPICKLCLPMRVPTLVDLDDLSYTYHSNLTKNPIAAFLSKRKTQFADHMASAQLHRFTSFFFASQKDADRMPFLRGHVLPNIPHHIPDNPPPPPRNSKTLLFVGPLWYRPNYEGIQHFLENIWPQILSCHPDATLNLAGDIPTHLRRAWTTHPRTNLSGFVTDLDSAYKEAAIVIAPIYSGGGTNIKILEAAAHQRPCVTTPFSYDSLRDCFNGATDILVAPNHEKFATMINTLLTNPEQRIRHGRESATVIRKNYTRNHFHRTVISSAHHLLERHYQNNTS